jgi:hypothetical protein
VIGPSRRTYKQLVDEVLSWGGMSSDTNRLRTLAKYAVAESHRKRLSGTRWSFMLYPQPQTLSIVGGRQFYSLHDAFLTPQYFRSRTDGRTIRLVPLSRELDYLPADYTATGSPRFATLAGYSKVHTQPSQTSVLGVTSSNAADSSKTVTFVGETASGIVSETIPVFAIGTVEFSTILDVTKNGEGWQGTMVAGDAFATVILSLGATSYGRQFPQLKTLTVPSGAETWEYNFFRQPKQLSSDYDIPDTPEPFASIHVLDALLKMQDHMRPTAQTVNQWRSDQAELEADMAAAFQHGLSQDSEAEYINLIDRD